MKEASFAMEEEAKYGQPVDVCLHYIPHKHTRTHSLTNTHAHIHTADPVPKIDEVFDVVNPQVAALLQPLMFLQARSPVQIAACILVDEVFASLRFWLVGLEHLGVDAILLPTAEHLHVNRCIAAPPQLTD